jgi:L-fuconolactonase
VIDAHHHLWDTTARDYPFLADDAMAPVRKPYVLDDLRRETSAAGVEATVLVQTIPDFEESVEFLRIAAGSGGLIAGVVGWVDLTADDVAAQIAKLRKSPGGDRLVSIRALVQSEPDQAWIARPDVRRGLQAVARAGLVYDLLVLVPQLPVAKVVAREMPDLRFVLDHAAKPYIAAGKTEPWDSEIRELAKLPNVACKLSGLVTEASWTSWDTPQIAPYAAHVLECFGADRVMFGTDWPVCELAASYAEVVALARELTSELSDAERAQVFQGVAQEWYGLRPPAST